MLCDDLRLDIIANAELYRSKIYEGVFQRFDHMFLKNMQK